MTTGPVANASSSVLSVVSGWVSSVSSMIVPIAVSRDSTSRTDVSVSGRSSDSAGCCAAAASAPAKRIRPIRTSETPAGLAAAVGATDTAPAGT